MKARLTITEAAARLGVTRGTVAAWIKAGRLPAIREGRCMMIDPAGLESMQVACNECGAVFMPSKVGQRFCSDTCRKRNVYQQHKASHPVTRPPGRPRREFTAVTDPAPVPDRLAGVLDFTRKHRTD